VQKSIHTPEQKVLQDLLRQIRLEANITQVEMGRRLEKGQNFVSNYERGERLLDLIELDEVCKAAGVELVDFVRRFKGINGKENTLTSNIV